MFPLSPCNSCVPTEAFCLCDGWDLATVAMTRGMGVMIPNTLVEPEYQNEQLYAWQLGQNSITYCVLLLLQKKEVTDTPKFVAVNICLFLSKESNDSSCKNCRLLCQLPDKHTK